MRYFICEDCKRGCEVSYEPNVCDYCDGLLVKQSTRSFDLFDFIAIGITISIALFLWGFWSGFRL